MLYKPSGLAVVVSRWSRAVLIGLAMLSVPMGTMPEAQARMQGKPAMSRGQAVPAATTVQTPRPCDQIKALNPVDLPPEVEAQALQDAEAHRDPICLAHLAVVLHAKASCDGANKVAEQAARLAPALPIVRLAVATTQACLLTRKVAVGLTGAPSRCEERMMIDIADGLSQGALLSDVEGAPELTLGTLQSLARVCRDEQRLLSSVFNLISQRFPPRNMEQASCVVRRQQVALGSLLGDHTPLGLTGGVMRCDFRAALTGISASAPAVLRQQSLAYLREALHDDPSCLKRGDDGCVLAAQALLHADQQLSETPEQAPNSGMVMDDYLYLARSGGVQNRLLLHRAARSFPLWLVRAALGSELLRTVDDLLWYLREERGYLPGAMLALSLELVRTFATAPDACRQAAELHQSLSDFAGPSSQEPPERWGDLVLEAARSGKELASACPHGAELVRFFTSIVDLLQQSPPQSPFAVAIEPDADPIELHTEKRRAR